MKNKYHNSKRIGRHRCVGERCIICWMLGRTHSLYGEEIKPYPFPKNEVRK